MWRSSSQCTPSWDSWLLPRTVVPAVSTSQVIRWPKSPSRAGRSAVQPSLVRVRANRKSPQAKRKQAGFAQKQESWQYKDADGSMYGQQITPLDRVGMYVPGGKAAYPSSVLMNALPARVAGVRELAMVVPTPFEKFNWNR